MILDTIGTLVIGGALAALLATITSTLAAPLVWRITLAALGGAWVSLVVGAIAAGDGNSPAIFVSFAVPILGIGLCAALSRASRTAIMSIPATAIIGLNVVRVLGVDFLLLVSDGRLAGPFPFSAGIGDIITGLAAVPVAVLASRTSLRDPRIMVWNAFGALDLLAAVVLGVGSRNGSPLQFIHAGVGSDGFANLPWALVPLVLVPLFLIGHVIVFAHAASEPRTSTRPAMA